MCVLGKHCWGQGWLWWAGFCNKAQGGDKGVEMARKGDKVGDKTTKAPSVLGENIPVGLTHSGKLRHRYIRLQTILGRDWAAEEAGVWEDPRLSSWIHLEKTWHY